MVKFSVKIAFSLKIVKTSVQDNQVYDYYNRQTFTIRPSLDINVPVIHLKFRKTKKNGFLTVKYTQQRGYIQELYDSWGWMVDQSFSLKPSQLFKFVSNLIV